MNQHVFRVDKFLVPAISRDEFLGRVRTIHALLKEQTGFVRDIVLEQVSGNGELNFVTIVEWDGQAYIDKAKAAVALRYSQTGFNPQEMFERLGIKADLGNYQRVDV